MSDILVDIQQMRHYASAAQQINDRLTTLDWRLKTLYGQVGLLGLWDLLQADLLTGHSWTLRRCRDYLNRTADDFEKLEKSLQKYDPLDFKKPPETLLEAAYNVGCAIKKGAQQVKKWIYDAAKATIESYLEKGWAYQVVQYGKAVIKAATGVSKIAIGVGALVSSAGMSGPVAILMVIKGANEIYNSVFDAAYTYVGDYKKIGTTNGLKDCLTSAGGAIGNYLGSEKLGEIVGGLTYFGVDLVTSYEQLHYSLDKIKQLNPTNLGNLGKELREIRNLNLPNLFTMDVENIRYQLKLAGYTYKEAKNIVQNTAELYHVAERSVAFGKSINNMFGVFMPGKPKNAAIEFFDSADKIKKRTTSAVKCASKVTHYIFD